MPSDLKKIGVDFDGVLHDGSGYGEEAMGKPLKGSKQAVEALQGAGYEPYVLTARTDHENVSKWLSDNGFPDMEVTNVKKPSLLYIDDRAVRHTDWKKTMKEVATKLSDRPTPLDAKAN